MKTKVLMMLVAVVLAVANVASADIVRGINMDFVTIGNAGNAADTQVMFTDGTTGYGAVGYEYQLGKYEVTNGQWDAVVSAAGAPTGNPPDAYDQSAYWTGTDIPTNEVSWYEAAQFCNYLTSGDKSLGAYLFRGNNTNPGDFLGIDRDSAVSTYGIAYVIPTEDEWYKAAYYTGSGYSTYANGQETIPVADNGWNYAGASSSPWDVGTGTMEQNGTFDMMGNVWEWNETFIFLSDRGHRGASYHDGFDSWLSSSGRFGTYPYEESIFGVMGFRVASVPEPCSLVMLSLGGLVLLRRRRVS